MTPIEPVPAGCRILVHVQPRASRSEIVGLHGDALKIRVAAPPVEGEANAALCRFLADRLDVPLAAVRLVRGDTARRKLVEITGRTPAEARRRFGL